MGKIITFDREARESVFQGIEEVAKVVATTMGPYGYNVILDQLRIEPEVTNDGVTVARTIDYDDRYKNIGAMMMKKAADRTNKIAGDGTSTTTILAYSIMREGLKYIDNGVNPFKLSKYMTEISEGVIDYIKKHAIPVNGQEDIVKVATISAQDEEIGKLIGDAYASVGKGGTIVTKESNHPGLSLEIKNGLEFESQIESIHLITNEQRQQCELVNPYIFVTDKRLNTLGSIKNMLDSLVKSGEKDILLIVDDIDPVALATLVVNKKQGVFNVGVVKAPLYATLKENFFRDVCALTGATMISHKTGLDFENAGLDLCGRAEMVLSGRQSTIIVGGKRNEEEIKRISEGLEESLKTEIDEWNRMQLEARLAKLTGGIATIKVGYPSNIETTQKRMKIDDAIMAVKSAIQEGIIRGEGASLIEGMQRLNPGRIDQEYAIADKILATALKYPMKVLVDNSGESGDRAIKEKMNLEKGMGFDFESKTFVNLLEKGIIDPVKVIRVALENAVSLANMLLTSRAIITEVPKKDEDQQDFKVS